MPVTKLYFYLIVLILVITIHTTTGFSFGFTAVKRYVHKYTETTLFGEEEVETVETYTGSCEPTLKARVQGYLSSFRYEKYRHSTRLSRYIHSLKDEEKEYSIDWKVIDKQKSFSSNTNMCWLCLAESYAILYGDSASITSMDEVWGQCRHSRKHMLSAAKVRMPAL